MVNEKHHKYSPSSAARLMQCSGSEKMQRGIPDESTAPALEGQMLHAVLEGDPAPAPLDDEQQELLSRCSEYAEIMTDEDGTVYREIHVKIMDLRDFSLLTEGTADYIVISADGKRATLIDWKFGRVKVSAPAVNMQLALYAAGVAQKFGVEAVEAHIYQPRLSDFDAPPPYVFTNFSGIVARYAAAVKRAESPTLSLTAGDECGYCRALSVCPAIRLLEAEARTIEEITPERAEELYDKAQIMKKWAFAVTSEVFYLVATEQVPSLEIEEKPGKRAIQHEGKAALYDELAHLLTAEEINAGHWTTIGIGKLETEIVTRLRKAAPELKTKDAKQIAKDRMKAAVTIGAPQQSIKRRAD